MPHSTPNFEEIREDYLRDTVNLDDSAHVDGDSDTFVVASATASAVDGLYHDQRWIARQIFPDTADPENIERHAAQRGIYLKSATRARGFVTLYSPTEDLAPFAAGVVVTHPKTQSKVHTTASWEGGFGESLFDPATEQWFWPVTVPCEAAQTGPHPEYSDPGEPVLVQNAPPGIAGHASLTISGGTAQENHAELLARLQFYMQHPPGGGTKYDYERWAMEVPGVTWAKCYPIRRGLGTVDVVILSNKQMPPAALVTEAQAHVDANRPVMCPDCKIFAPTPVLVDVHAKVRLAQADNMSLPVVRPLVYESLDRHFAGVMPGDGVVVAKLNAVVLSTKHITDAATPMPVSNMPPRALHWPRLGEVTLGVL